MMFPLWELAALTIHAPEEKTARRYAFTVHFEGLLPMLRAVSDEPQLFVVHRRWAAHVITAVERIVQS